MLIKVQLSQEATTFILRNKGDKSMASFINKFFTELELNSNNKNALDEEGDTVEQQTRHN